MVITTAEWLLFYYFYHLSSFFDYWSLVSYSVYLHISFSKSKRKRTVIEVQTSHVSAATPDATAKCSKDKELAAACLLK